MKKLNTLLSMINQQRVETFKQLLAEANITEQPRIVTDYEDGEVDFRWSKDGGYATAAFLPDGSFVGGCRLPGSHVYDIEIETDEFPSIELLNHFFTLLRKF